VPSEQAGRIPQRKVTGVLRESIRKRHDGEGGFTLVELLVVIVVLGVLSAIVVFSVAGVNNKSKSAACNSDVKSVETAEEAYYAQNNAYATVGGLVTAKLLRSAPSTANGYTISADATTGVVTVTPACSTL
jgi:prepilin-type N-terminal cleavage/methylation domain-containing protein